MKAISILLCAVSLLICEEIKSGYYYSITDFLQNTPKPADKSTRVVTGEGELGSNTPAYYLEELVGSDYKKVRRKSYGGYCDSGKVYIVDSNKPIKGKIMRSAVVGSKFSYYFGVDMKNGAAKGSSASKKQQNGTSYPVPVLEVINMKTGKITSVSPGIFQKLTMKKLLAEYPDLLNEYQMCKSCPLDTIATYFDRANGKDLSNKE